ncbi:MAG: hypothetical protein M3P42_05650 [Actinomycetota bacterium]|nr:hypothetical protein [Actinomycetota bacterium]
MGDDPEAASKRAVVIPDEDAGLQEIAYLGRREDRLGCLSLDRLVEDEERNERREWLRRLFQAVKLDRELRRLG